MKQAKKTLAAGLLGVAALGVSPVARAVTYAESGDAGQTLAGAQYTAATPAASGQPLTTLTGTIAGTNGLDADVFVLTITNTTTFSAVASSAAGIDTSLFLFSSTGAPILANDDQSGASFQAGILAGNSLLTSLAAGTYYLGVSLSGNEAVNSASQQLFTVDQPTTNQRGAATGLNPASLGNFSGNTFVAEGGDYSIALTGASTLSAAVPEPSTYASLALGAGALAFLARRRRSQTA